MMFLGICFEEPELRTSRIKAEKIGSSVFCSFVLPMRAIQGRHETYGSIF
jgi:hypothetical protein